MALFKISKGLATNLPTTYNEGYCYFTTDDGKFYIDTNNTATGRIALNADKADKDGNGNVIKDTYLPLTGGNVSGVLQNGRWFRNVAAFSNTSSYCHEIVIKTKIPFTNSVGMPIIKIDGYDYRNGTPISILISFYIYGGVFQKPIYVNNGSANFQSGTLYLSTYDSDDGKKYIAVSIKAGTMSMYYPRGSVDYLDVALANTVIRRSQEYAKGWTVELNTEKVAVPTTTIIPQDNIVQLTQQPLATSITGSASQLSSSITEGSVNQPVYFDKGVPVATKVKFFTQQDVDFSQVSAWANLNNNKSSSTGEISIIRNKKPATWQAKSYSTGLYFKLSDTAGFIDLSYDTPVISIGGSSDVLNRTEPQWYIKLTGTSKKSYNLDKIITSITVSGAVVGTASYNTDSANINISTLYDAYTVFGGKNLVNTYSALDAALIKTLGANRLAGIPSDAITVEHSSDDGQTWEEYAVSDDVKKTALFSSDDYAAFYLRGSNSALTADKLAGHQLRITIDGVVGRIYTALRKFAMYITTNGSTNCKVSMDASYYESPDEFVNFVDGQSISGWSGWNIINKTLPGSGKFGGTNQTNHCKKIRFTFSATPSANETTSTGFYITKIYGYGGAGCGVASYLGRYGTPYKVLDNGKDVAFEGALYGFNGSNPVNFSKGLTVNSGQFKYASIEVAGANVARAVWFANKDNPGIPVYNTNFTYNPATGVLKATTFDGKLSWDNITNKPSYYDASMERTKNTFLAAPASANGAATFRAITKNDLPTRLNRITVYGQKTADNGSYNKGSIEIFTNTEEDGYSATDNDYAPTLGFHWPYVVGGSIRLKKDGVFHFFSTANAKGKINADLVGNADTATRLSDIIGVRNLLEGFKTSPGYARVAFVNGNKGVKINASDTGDVYFRLLAYENIPAGTYTLSCDVSDFPEGAAEVPFIIKFGTQPIQSNRLVIAGNSRAWATFVVATDTNSKELLIDDANSTLTYAINGTILSNFKLEKGNAATDYLPAPETIVEKDYITNYIASKGENLVVNGSGAMGDNTNFSSLTFDGYDNYYSPGCFKATPNKNNRMLISNDFYMFVDVNKKYKLSYMLKVNKDDIINYDGLFLYDIDKNLIEAQYVMFVKNSTTSLTEDLKPGDTIIHLASVAGFNKEYTQTYRRKIIVWNYVNSFGYQYPAETYSRNIYNDLWTDSSSFDTTANTITLKAAWSGPTIPAGTMVSQGNSGGVAPYGNSYFRVAADEWIYKEYSWSGVDTSGNMSQPKFWPGTAYVRVLFYFNYNFTSGASFKITNVSLTALPDTIELDKVKADITSLKNDSNKFLQLYSNSTRPTSADITHVSDGSIVHFKATSSMTTNKPPKGDSHVLHFFWDSGYNADAQLSVGNNLLTDINWRTYNNTTTKWNSWKTVLDTYNYNTYVVPKAGGDFTGSISVSGNATISGKLTASTVEGAVWNDYAEYRETLEYVQPGRCVVECGDDTLIKSTMRMMPSANIVSDTFGFSIGKTDRAKTPIAVAGRVLAYTDEHRNTFCPGDAVCSGPNGTVSKMTREEVREYPDRIIGIVSAIPAYDKWGSDNVAVDGRIWIKIK